MNRPAMWERTRQRFIDALQNCIPTILIVDFLFSLGLDYIMKWRQG